MCCWNCGHVLMNICAFFCPECNKLQPVSDDDDHGHALHACSYFDYFTLYVIIGGVHAFVWPSCLYFYVYEYGHFIFFEFMPTALFRVKIWYCVRLPQFGVNVKSLEQQFWTLQKQLHPDRFGTASEREQTLSARNAMLLNRAYSTLKDPTSRIAYLLTLHDIDALSEKSNYRPSPTLLMHVMEIGYLIWLKSLHLRMHFL